MPLLTSHIPPLFSALPYLASFLLITTLAIITRLIHILPYFTPRTPTHPRRSTAHICIVLGSGGHTAEMLSMIRTLDTRRYTLRTYIVSSGDAFSEGKAREFERRLGGGGSGYDGIMGEGLEGEGDGEGDERMNRISKNEVGVRREGENGNGNGAYRILHVPRARHIHQSLLTTPLSALQTLYTSFLHLLPTPSSPSTSHFPSPDLILTNGPATGVIIILAGLLIRFFALEGEAQMRSVYVESWARVRTLSLSGRVCGVGGKGLVDRFLVQWEGLGGRGTGREFVGVLVE